VCVLIWILPKLIVVYPLSKVPWFGCVCAVFRAVFFWVVALFMTCAPFGPVLTLYGDVLFGLYSARGSSHDPGT